MNNKGIKFVVLASLVILLCGFRPADYCVVKGTVKGVADGASIELQDLWQGCKVVGTAIVKDGAFEIHPDVTCPAHVFLYQGDFQLQDFILEPGVINVNIDAAEGDNYGPGVTGTPSNDTQYQYRTLKAKGDVEAAKALMDSVLAVEQTGPLALSMAESHSRYAVQALDVLNRLTPDLANINFVKELKEELTLRMKTEPRTDYKPQFIDLEYSDSTGNPVRLSSVVNRPQNRYVLLDFWATWCVPCVRSFPKLKELYAKYHSKGLEIYSISLDNRERRWKSFLKENSMPWIHVRDDIGGGKASKLWESYAINVIPMLILIDCQTGEILLRENQPDLESILSERLK